MDRRVSCVVGRLPFRQGAFGARQIIARTIGALPCLCDEADRKQSHDPLANLGADLVSERPLVRGATPAVDGRAVSMCQSWKLSEWYAPMLRMATLSRIALCFTPNWRTILAH